MLVGVASSGVKGGDPPVLDNSVNILHNQLQISCVPIICVGSGEAQPCGVLYVQIGLGDSMLAG